MKFYRMLANDFIADYVVPNTEELQEGCFNSEFQFLDHQDYRTTINKDGGSIFPDFLNFDNVPLASLTLYHLLVNELKIDNLFQKKIILTAPKAGLYQEYQLLLPPQISCHYQNRQGHVLIDPKRVGNYQIFKLDDDEIKDLIVTEKVKTKVSRARLENIQFVEFESGE